MERSTPLRKPNTSTSDLLTWTDAPSPALSSANAASISASRSHQPSDGISKVVFGGQVTDEESESLNKRKPCSGYKLKEITGSKIFADEEGEAESGNVNPNSLNKTGLRIYQQAVNGISQISFSVEEKVSPKKPCTLPEVAKQRELSGTIENENMKITKQISNAKCKELSGNDIFSPAPDVPPRRSLAAVAKENKAINSTGGSNILFGEEPVVQSAKKLHNQKFAELTGNDIFKGDIAPGSAEKSLSSAKLREMSGNNIFSDGKSESREYVAGLRKPPGGESSIALV